MEFNKMYQTLSLNNKLINIASEINSKRVEKHLRNVLNKLESKDTSTLTIPQKQNRAKTLSYLKEYIELGEYPINENSISRHAIFRDKYGNYCAVGYLMHKHGKDNLIDEIESNNNLVYINEIDDKKYLDAITGMGITVDEAAMIQPTYGWEDPFYRSAYSNNDDKWIIALIAVSAYVLFQLTAFLLVRRIDKPRSTKVLMFLTMFFGSTLVGIIIYLLLDNLQ